MKIHLVTGYVIIQIWGFWEQTAFISTDLPSDNYMGYYNIHCTALMDPL